MEALRTQLQGKRDDLLKLRQKEGFKLLELKALQLNATTDRLITLVDEMQALNRQIQGGKFSPLSVDVNLSELPYADILTSTIRVRSRSSVIQARLVQAKNNR